MNLGRGGGEGSLGGVISRCSPTSDFPDLLGAGGGGGAAARRAGAETLSEFALCTTGGGGGGGALKLPPPPFRDGGGRAATRAGLPCASWSWRRKSMMKSWLSRMKSSVSPFALRSSPKFSLHRGSKASSVANSEGVVWPPKPFMLPDRPCPTNPPLGDSGGVGADEWRWPKSPPSKECL